MSTYSPKSRHFSSKGITKCLAPVHVTSAVRCSPKLYTLQVEDQAFEQNNLDNLFGQSSTVQLTLYLPLKRSATTCNK